MPEDAATLGAENLSSTRAPLALVDVENVGPMDSSLVPPNMEVTSSFPLSLSETRLQSEQSSSSMEAPPKQRDAEEPGEGVSAGMTMGVFSSSSSMENGFELVEGSSMMPASEEDVLNWEASSASAEDKEVKKSPGQQRQKLKATTMRPKKAATVAGKKRWSSFKFRSNTAPEISPRPNEVEFLRWHKTPTLERCLKASTLERQQQQTSRLSTFYYSSPFVQPNDEDLPSLELHSKSTPGLSELLQSVCSFVHFGSCLDWFDLTGTGEAL